MFRARGKSVAEKLAKEHQLSHGFSTIDGWWYVGTPVQLERCGCTKQNTIIFGSPESK